MSTRDATTIHDGTPFRCFAVIKKMAPKGAIIRIKLCSAYARQAAGRNLAITVPPVQLQAIEPPVGTVEELAAPESAAPPDVGNNVMVPFAAAAV